MMSYMDAFINRHNAGILEECQMSRTRSRLLEIDFVSISTNLDACIAYLSNTNLSGILGQHVRLRAGAGAALPV